MLVEGDGIMRQTASTQTPIAVVGMACRLPGDCNSPEEFWKFLLGGGVADTKPPSSRFSLEGHYDKTLRPWTMRSPGGMFINADPRDIDAGFFGLSHVDAISMDPQQRQLLEVVYEGLENAGLSMEAIKSSLFGCFVGSYASDYSDIQTRDPEDRTPSFTVGSGRAMLSNRISHFLDIKGPSMTIDTACSGSLIAVDLACRYLESGDADGAIVAGCNLYMSPEHNMDQHAMTSAASPSGRCWTFDARADGYIKAEAINCLVLKRLDDALRDGDPIRAVIRGTSTNSDGRTPGIASPSPDAQALAIRRAYSRAGIPSLHQTAYLECHGTGTLAGDPVECKAASSVFSATRPEGSLLRIGSVKSNIGHSEPAAGISGMIKTVLAVERGIIPGNPTFEIPNPKIDFQAYKLLASKSAALWPRGMLRRASVNSFGYGGSNAHAIVEHPSVLLGSQYEPAGVTSYSAHEGDMFGDDDFDVARRLLVFSANDEVSLKAYVKQLIRHISNPVTNVKSADLAYTLAQRRTRHFFRAYAVSDGAMFKESQVVYGKLASAPRIGFVFTGQGAQWPQMGRDLIRNFPKAEETVRHLDQALQSMSDPPAWSLSKELCETRSVEHFRLPEFSQPLVTALQLALLAVLHDLGIKPAVVVGHSSGEVAAAVAAGKLTQEEGIKVAYLRGKAAKDVQEQQTVKLGMLAAGLGSQDVQPFINPFEGVDIACINSPKSVTLAGRLGDLERIEAALKAEGHFARVLMVDLAYHSRHMKLISDHYHSLLLQHCPHLSPRRSYHDVKFYSTVQGDLWENGTGIDYWVRNMSSPVRFAQAAAAMLQQGVADHLIELGPSGALAGPIKQIKQQLPQDPSPIQYSPALERSRNSTAPLFDLAGKMFLAGVDIDLAKVNGIETSGPSKPKVVIDLPNYSWNHSIKYWHESLASTDWRYRKFPVHDLLGTKVLGTSWKAPSWRRTLRLKDVPWIRDHTIGTDIVFPASGYVAMAVEAMFQTAKASGMENFSDMENVSQASYRLRDVRLLRALVVDEDASQHLHFFLNPAHGQNDTWFQFKISSRKDEIWTDHCSGSVRIGSTERLARKKGDNLAPLRHPSPATLWYKSMQSVGFNFGTSFQNLLEIESVAGQRSSRARIAFPPLDAQKNESKYVVHPAVFDSFFQAGIPSLYQGHRTLIDKALVPHLIDEILISTGIDTPTTAIATTSSAFTTGRPDKAQNYTSSAAIYNEETCQLIAEVRGLHYNVLHVPETTESRPTFLRSSWKPDISLLDNHTDLETLATSAGKDVSLLSSGLRLPQVAGYLFSLLQYKIALPSVLDLDLTAFSGEHESPSDFSADEAKSVLETCTRYISASSTPENMTDAQTRLKNIRGVEFHIYDPTSLIQQQPPFNAEDKFDLIIVRLPHHETDKFDAACRAVTKFCSPHGFVILVQQHDSSPELLSESSWASVELDMETVLHSAGLNLEAKALFSGVYLCTPFPTPEAKSAEARFRVNFPVVDLSGGRSIECSTFLDSLQTLGWTGSAVDLSTAALGLPGSANSLVIVDDPHSPLLANVTKSDWGHLRSLLTHGHDTKLIWLTSGSQVSVSSPSNALIHGFARSLRNEEATMSLTTLDLSSFIGSHIASKTVLQLLTARDALETEYCERGGVLHVSRVLPDEPLVREVAEGQSKGADLRHMWLRKKPKTVRLYCEKVGAMDSIHFNEVPDTDISQPLGDGEVEVEIRAAGLNYKDIATTLGLVPENEYLLGLEGAGIITQVGANVTSYRIGDRVLVHGKGCFANRNRVPKENIFLLPDWISFEQAATMSIVYFTAVYSLMEIVQVRKGQSVLIHSAAGGVGIASIQICKMLGAEIFATVGNEEKTRFLIEEYGIPPERIFSSRITGFGDGIRSLTNGRGVDFVLNSLTGNLLDESWRLLADNGTLLEIGKRDIVARHSLSMEPLDRNCSYKGIDISRPSILDDLPLVERVLLKIRQLLVWGHIKPISPMKVFSFTKIVDAMRYMRSGEHIGKLVISDGETVEDIKVLVRRAPHSLNFSPNSAYLIAGGLKGLCGSLAIYMARCGAKHLITMSRSGAEDDRSRKVVEDLTNLGAAVTVAKGDISNLNDVTRIFQQSALPIKGVIQGAMLLRDKTFESMTHQEYHEALASKLAGTWNLHTAAAELSSTGHKLDFFTMLSSISGVVGTAGQANYAAGNSFQDAFARYRHSLGLAAHTVDLGIVQDVGYMSEHQALTDRVRSRSQLSGINERQLHEILRLSILQQIVGLSPDPQSRSQMIIGLPFPLPEDSPVLADRRFHSLLRPSHSQDSTGSGAADKGEGVDVFQSMVKAGLPSEKLIGEAIKLVNKQMVRVLGLSADMEASKSLSSYGIDSLAAVDLRNWFKTRLGAELTTLDVLNASSLEGLCGKVVDKLVVGRKKE